MCKSCEFFQLTVKINCPRELTIDVQNGELSMMSDAACNVLTKARKNVFVRMPWDKL